MSGFLNDPPRLKEKHDQANLAERIAGQAFRDMVPAPPLSPTALARIAARVEERAPLPGRGRLRWAFVCCALLLGIATVASAQRLNILPRWLSRPFAPQPKLVSHRPPAPGILRHGPVAPRTDVPPAVAVQAEKQTTETEPSTPARGQAQVTPDLDRSKPDRPTGSGRHDLPSAPRQQRKVATATTPLATGAPPAAAHAESGSTPSLEPKSAPAPSPAIGDHGVHLALVEQKERATTLAKSAAVERPTTDPTEPAASAGAQSAAKYLGQAIRALRIERSPKSALALLDRHSIELDRDAFAHEALLLRVEAMLALGQESRVLRLLDGMSLADLAASRALLVTRGRLRAAVNRCSEAIGDFDRVLAEAGQPSKQALLERARCRKRLGDTAGAQSDLERYRREFPDDPAAQVTGEHAGAL